MSSPLLKLEGVSKSYPSGHTSVEALKNIELEVERGQFLALVGKSGSGKTTLLQLISGLDWPSTGRVLFEGRNLASMGRSQLAELRGSRIGFVFQTFNLIPSLTALENVELPLLLLGVSPMERNERARSLLDQVELKSKLEQRPPTLSGGEKQRVAIARSLACDPELILADEPTGNLDERAGQHVLEMLSEIHEQGKTVILATHDANAAKRAEAIIMLRDGEIVQKDLLK